VNIKNIKIIIKNGEEAITKIEHFNKMIANTLKEVNGGNIKDKFKQKIVESEFKDEFEKEVRKSQFQLLDCNSNDQKICNGVDYIEFL
jgi:hypothetical protein